MCKVRYYPSLKLSISHFPEEPQIKLSKGWGSIVVVKISEKLLKILSQNLNNLEQAQKEWSRDAGSTPQRGQVGSKSGNILLSCTLDQWIRCTTLNWISLCLELTEEECILFKTAFQVSFSNVILKSSSQRDFNDLLDGVCLLFIIL